MINKLANEFILARNISNISIKKKIMNILFYILYRILGIKRYIFFLRALPFYSRFENHNFILKIKKTTDKNLFYYNK